MSTEQYTDDRPTFADFAQKHAITMIAALAPSGSNRTIERETLTEEQLYRKWYDYFFPRSGGVRKLDRSKTERQLNRATSKDKGYIYVPDFRTRADIDLMLTFNRNTPAPIEGFSVKPTATMPLAYMCGIGFCKASTALERDPYDIDHLAVYVKTPSAGDVLSSLADECMSVTNALSYEEWCGDFGYDEDSRKGERIYRACQAQAAKLRAFLGHAAYADLISGNYQPA